MPQPARYSAIQIALHWGVVILIVVQLLTGDLMAEYFDALLRPEALARRGVATVLDALRGLATRSA